MKALTTILGTAVLGLSLFTGSAVAGSHGDNDHDKPGVMVHEAWVRAVPPSSKMSAAYLVVHNNTDSEEHLVSAESEVADSVELHNVRKKDGMMEMYQVKSIGIPANASRELKPGSYHVMLIGLKQPLKAGDEVALTLNFMHAGAITIKAPVQEGGMQMQHNHMQH